MAGLDEKKSGKAKDDGKAGAKAGGKGAPGKSSKGGGGARKLRRLCRATGKRSEEDVQRLADLSRSLSHFYRDLPDVMQIELAKVMQLEEFLKYDPVFKQGDSGTKFYIIASGKVDINVTIREERRTPFEQPRERTTTVATLSKGESFGEIALVKDQPRSATIVAKTRLELLVISKDDFQRTLTDLYGSPLSERVAFLEGLPTFQGVPRTDIISMAQYISIAVFSPGATFHPDKDQRVCFLVEGTCRLRRGVTVEHKPEKDDLTAMFDRNTICSMAPGNFFGESCVFPDLSRDWYVEANTQVKIFFVGKQDFKQLSPEVQGRVAQEAEFKVTYHDEVIRESQLRQKLEKEKRQALVRQEEATANKGDDDEDDEEEMRRMMNPDREFHQEGTRLNDLEDFKECVLDSVEERAENWNAAGCWPKVFSPRSRPYTAGDALSGPGTMGAGEVLGAGDGLGRAATAAPRPRASRGLAPAGGGGEGAGGGGGAERLPLLDTTRPNHGGPSGAMTDRTFARPPPRTPRTPRARRGAFEGGGGPRTMRMKPSYLQGLGASKPGGGFGPLGSTPSRRFTGAAGGEPGAGGEGPGRPRPDAFGQAGLWGLGGKSQRHSFQPGEFRSGTREYVFADQLEARAHHHHPPPFSGGVAARPRRGAHASGAQTHR